eukprot:2876665-Rhodomonas_salina.1
MRAAGATGRKRPLPPHRAHGCEVRGQIKCETHPAPYSLYQQPGGLALIPPGCPVCASFALRNHRKKARVEGPGSRVQVQGPGSRGLGSRVWGLGSRV